MKKSVLLSIQPKWCELISSRKKTIEVRKTRPKYEPPFKCYIYCTKGDSGFDNGDCFYTYPEPEYRPIQGNGKIIGEFVCDSIDKYESEFCEKTDCYEDIRLIWDNEDLPDEDCRNFKIITSNEKENPNDCYLCKDSCLTFAEIKKYVGIGFTNTFYGWHISDLKIYDKPKELGKFYTVCNRSGNIEDRICLNCPHLCFDSDPINGYTRWCGVYKKKPLKKPPQSWCYVEEKKANDEL